MSSELIWKRLVGAAAEPADIDDDRVRRQLLSDAMTLGSTITTDSVGCSITETLRTGYRTPVASNSLAQDLDDAQYRDDDGPCIAACRDGQVHSIRIMADEAAYGGFTRAAIEQNVGSSLSVPLAGLARASALNLYARTADAFEPPHARAVAMLLARCTTAVLGSDPFHATSTAASRSAAGPRPATVRRETPGLDPRRREIARVVGEALDLLAARDSVDRAQAFAALTRLSRVEGRSVVAICRDLLSDVPQDHDGVGTQA